MAVGFAQGDGFGGPQRGVYKDRLTVALWLGPAKPGGLLHLALGHNLFRREDVGLCPATATLPPTLLRSAGKLSRIL